DVALKVVNKDARLDPSSGENLLREARASSALTHPNICTIYEVGETNGELYIVMELVEGKSLRALSMEPGLPPESVLRYGVQIASALVRAHDKGIVHRDLKSDNILLTADGLIKVLDFGLARHADAATFDGATRSFGTLEQMSSVSGTLAYMAPEVLRGEDADYRSDLCALGVVLYEAVSGRLPFDGRTGFEISSAILREVPKPLGSSVPPGLWAVIQKCLAKEPIQRYQRAGEAQAALEAVQSAAIVSTDRATDQSGPRQTVLLGARTGRRARPALLRRRTGGALRKPRRRRHVDAGARVVRAPAPAAMDARERRADAAHDCAGSDRASADVRRDLRRRRVSHRGRR